MMSDKILDNTYQVLQEIGRGGAGIIFQAYHLRLQKYVVLKQIQAGPGDAEMLRREVDLLKNLHHEYLPQVYDFFIADGRVFTVMDYIPGENLGEVAKQIGGISENRLIKWFCQLAQVIDYLHTRPVPVLHSDIKPENIILTDEDNICLIDFNISLGESDGGKPKGFSRNYASPEQLWLAENIAMGHPVNWRLNAATDIYSAGATFYYLMTGEIPVSDAQNRRLSDREDIPYSQGLRAIVDRCMAWDRKQRYRSAQKLLSALKNVKKQDRRYKRYLLAQAGSIACATCLAAGGLALLIAGVKTVRMESFIADYQRFSAAMEGESIETARILGEDLLQSPQYADILKSRKAEKAFLLHTLGNACYSEGEKEKTLYYYSQAIAVSDVSNENLGTYYYDYALALLESGRQEEAEAILEQGRSFGTDQTALLLIEADIANQQGKTEVCLEKVNEVLEADPAGIYAPRACLIAASAVGVGTQEGIAWLGRLDQYNCSARELRSLAAGYLEAAQGSGGSSRKTELIKQAVELYEKLNERSNRTLEDRIGLGISYYALGQEEACVETLLACERDGEADYRIDFYLACAYFQLGRYSEAGLRCDSAMEKMEKVMNPIDPAVFQSDWDDLLELQRGLENRR